MANERDGRPIVIIDLDGTLADVEHRRALIKGKHRDYEGFHARCVDDRRRVVDMWRSEGLVCLQCDDWEEREAAERLRARPN